MNLEKKFNTNLIGKHFKVYYKINSTQITAKKHTNLDGLLVIAINQTKSLGRQNRTWDSSPGGLWFSAVLKPDIEPKDALFLVKLVSCSILSVLQIYEKSFCLKWPNDIVYKINSRYKKIAGILIDTSVKNNKLEWVVMGVGINVNNDLPDHLRKIAINLKDIIKVKEIDLNNFMTEIIESIDKDYANFISKKDMKYIEKQYENNLIKV